MNQTTPKEDESVDSTAPNCWEGDAFQRQGYAKFLTSYLVNRVTKNGEEDIEQLLPYCIALDAPWGEGKSFFVRRWCEQLTQYGHPTFMFDAWSADYQVDPVLAFVAAFRKEIETQIESLPTAAKVQKTAKDALASGMRNVRKAALPVATTILSGLAKKFIGTGFEELGDVSRDAQTASLKPEEVTQAALNGLDAGFQSCFDLALKEQSNRQSVFDEFKKDIEKVLTLLQKKADRKLPMFVFVDEIDRCRPTFAVELLEGLKHIFNIKGVCFVVSTNLPQLAHAVGAVYGANFDARSYLQRFFDVEYALPRGSQQEYLEVLLRDYPLLTSGQVYCGLPKGGFKRPKTEESSVAAIDWVSTVFGLDLRSQKRLLEMMVAAANSLPKDAKLHLMWVAILCAARIKSPKLFDVLRAKLNRTEQLDQAWNESVVSDSSRDFNHPDPKEKRFVLLKDVAYSYLKAAWDDLSNEPESGNLYDYPRRIFDEIRSDVSRASAPMSMPAVPSIRRYHEWVRCAGYLNEQINRVVK